VPAPASATNELHTVNVVRQVYRTFSNQEITNKIAQLITPPGLQLPVDVIYQTIESLHLACPNNLGDWYFTGNYPTPGGNRVVNKAFMNYMEGKLFLPEACHKALRYFSQSKLSPI
jgi:amidophosphoribosyltransferase